MEHHRVFSAHSVLGWAEPGSWLPPDGPGSGVLILSPHRLSDDSTYQNFQPFVPSDHPRKRSLETTTTTPTTTTGTPALDLFRQAEVPQRVTMHGSETFSMQHGLNLFSERTHGIAASHAAFTMGGTASFGRRSDETHSWRIPSISFSGKLLPPPMLHTDDLSYDAEGGHAVTTPPSQASGGFFLDRGFCAKEARMSGVKMASSFETPPMLKREPSCTSETSDSPSLRVPHLSGLGLLPLDMTEELIALDNVLSLGELRKGQPIALEKDLMKFMGKKGKGGRNQASDARLDPNVDPKKALRIMANRRSAARSKLRQKLASEGLVVKVRMLKAQKVRLVDEINMIKRLCLSIEDAGNQIVHSEPEPTAANCHGSSSCH